MSQLAFIFLFLIYFCTANGQGTLSVASGNIFDQNHQVSFVVGDQIFIPISNNAYSITASSLPVGNNQLITGIVSESFEIVVFPNPFTDKFFISLPSIHQIEMLDSKGVVLKRASLAHGDLDGGDLYPGMYFIKIYDGISSKTYKIIKNEN